MAKSNESLGEPNQTAGFVLGLFVLIGGTAAAVALIIITFVLSGGGWSNYGEIFQILWLGSLVLLTWFALELRKDEQEERTKFIATKAREASEEQERRENEARVMQALKIQQQLREQELRQEIELERLQGIYTQNRIKDRMQEVGLPRMAASSEDFEVLAAQWLYVWGDQDAGTTQKSRDGGIDVLSWCCLGQVKFYADLKVTPKEVRELKGAASVDPTRNPVFFAFCSGYTPDAIDFANRAGVALYQFQAETLTFLTVNPQAATIQVHLHSLL
jgi:hypothetical protein